MPESDLTGEGFHNSDSRETNQDSARAEVVRAREEGQRIGDTLGRLPRQEAVDSLTAQFAAEHGGMLPIRSSNPLRVMFENLWDITHGGLNKRRRREVRESLNGVFKGAPVFSGRRMGDEIVEVAEHEPFIREEEQSSPQPRSSRRGSFKRRPSNIEPPWQYEDTSAGLHWMWVRNISAAVAFVLISGETIAHFPQIVKGTGDALGWMGGSLSNLSSSIKGEFGTEQQKEASKSSAPKYYETESRPKAHGLLSGEKGEGGSGPDGVIFTYVRHTEGASSNPNTLKFRDTNIEAIIDEIKSRPDVWDVSNVEITTRKFDELYPLAKEQGSRGAYYLALIIRAQNEHRQLTDTEQKDLLNYYKTYVRPKFMLTQNQTKELLGYVEGQPVLVKKGDGKAARRVKIKMRRDLKEGKKVEFV